MAFLELRFMGEGEDEVCQSNPTFQERLSTDSIKLSTYFPSLCFQQNHRESYV